MNLGLPVSENNTLNLGLDYVHSTLSDMEPQVAVWRYLNASGVHPGLVTTSTNSDAQLSTNDFFASVGWAYNDLNRGFSVIRHARQPGGKSDHAWLGRQLLQNHL